MTEREEKRLQQEYPKLFCWLKFTSLGFKTFSIQQKTNFKSRWWLDKVEMRGTGMLTVEDQLGKSNLQRDARPLQIYVCYGSVACSMRRKIKANERVV